MVFSGDNAVWSEAWACASAFPSALKVLVPRPSDGIRELNSWFDLLESSCKCVAHTEHGTYSCRDIVCCVSNLVGYRQANMGRGMNRKRRRSEPAELHVRFPGKANRIFPHRWKQERAVKERRRSERLRGTYPVASVDVPVPCKVVYKKFGRGGLPQKSPMDLPPKNRLKVCPECGRSFNGIASLLRHRMHHTGEKRYECCFCGKGFCWRSDLSRHECIHTGKMPHECPFCGEGFDRKWKREAHQQMHMKSLALKDTESEKKY